jgi:hypothetical protein
MSVEWISQLREIVVDSLERSWLPFPIKEDLCEGWKKDLQVGPSSTILYTSCMYHIAPAIERAVGEPGEVRSDEGRRDGAAGLRGGRGRSAGSS